MGLTTCPDFTAIEQLTFASCSGIQTGWSDEAIDTQVMSAIFQAYCILIPTLLSVGHEELSIFDANYALTVTLSPFMVQLVFSSIRDALGFETSLFGQIKSHHRIIHFPVALFLILWFGLRLTLRLSSKAFQDSELCGSPTPKGLLVDLLLLFVPATGPTGGFWMVLSFLLLFAFSCVIEGLHKAVTSFLTRQGGALEPLRLHKRLSELWVTAKDLWCVSITRGT